MSIFVDESHPWAKYAPQKSLSSEVLLERSEHELRGLGKLSSTKPALWILDIDSTLLCLANRFQHIFFDYLRFHHDEPVPTVFWQIADGLKPSWHRYGIENCLEPAFVHWRVENPIQKAQQISKKMFPFWYQAFFSESYLDKDFAYPGAADFVNHLYKMGVHICYLTGRHAKTMTRGTRHGLRDLGFPVDDDRAFMILKSNEDESDVFYKQKYLRYLNQRYHVLGFMDNEPENIEAQLKINSKPMSVWFHSISSDRIPVLAKHHEPHLYVMRSFG